MARSVAVTRASTGRNRGILMLAILFGLLSAVLVFAFLNTKSSDKPQDLFDGSSAAESVVVATRDIQPGERITGDMVTTKTVPGAALQAGRFKETDLLVGKVATTVILSGEQVVAPKVTSFGDQNSVSFKVPDGKRAIGLMVPHEGWIVGGLVQPGDRVDVLGVTILSATDPLTGQEKLSVVSGVIAQDVEVLAVSQVLVKRIPNLDQKKPDTTTQPGESSATQPTTSSGSVQDADSYEEAISITLAMSIEEASKTALIDALKDDVGQYRVVVRQKGDGTPVTGQQAWRLEDVFTLR